MLSDQIDPVFRLPTFAPRHFRLGSEHFYEIATRLIDDRILIMGTLFERFVAKEEEAVRSRGNGENDVDQLCIRIFESCVQSTKRLTSLSDNLTHWAKVINRHKKSKAVMHEKRKRCLQIFLENCDDILRALDKKIDAFLELPTPEKNNI